jgi:hypothetical protein
LASYIQSNKSKLDDAKFLTQALIDEENKRLDAVLEKNRDILTAEARTRNESLNAELAAINIKDGISASEQLKIDDLNLKKKNNQNEYLTADAKLTEDSEKIKTGIATKYATQTSDELKLKQAQDFQQRLLDLEAAGATEYELQVAKLDNQTALEIQKFVDSTAQKTQLGVETRMAEDALLTEEQAIKDQLNAELQLTKDENEKIRIQNQLNAINGIEIDHANKSIDINNKKEEAKLQGKLQVMKGISQIFGAETAMGKAVAIASISIEKADAISKIISSTAVANAKAIAASPLTVGQPFVTTNNITAGLNIASAVGAGANAIGQITGISELSNIGSGISNISLGLSKIGGYATGGIITDGQPISRRNGDDVLITAKKGEVILNATQQRMLGGASTFASAGVPGFATGGIVGSNLTSVQKNISNSIDMTILAETIGKAVFEGANMGTATGSESGIIGLSNNKQIANYANF